MLKKIVGTLVILLLIFIAYVASRDGSFRYERSGLINAPKEKIYPYISNLKLGEKWSPFDMPGSEMKKTFSGDDGQVGSAMVFESKEAGSGTIKVTNVVPNEKVNMKLIMTAPISGDNDIEYILSEENGSTRFTWIMSGHGGFISKLMAVLIDCDKLIGGQFEEGISNLKRVVESDTNS